MISFKATPIKVQQTCLEQLLALRPAGTGQSVSLPWQLFNL